MHIAIQLEGGRVGASTTGSLQADANLTLSYPPSSDMPAACLLAFNGGNFSNISLKNVLLSFLAYILLPCMQVSIFQLVLSVSSYLCYSHNIAPIHVSVLFHSHSFTIYFVSTAIAQGALGEQAF